VFFGGPSRCAPCGGAGGARHSCALWGTCCGWAICRCDSRPCGVSSVLLGPGCGGIMCCIGQRGERLLRPAPLLPRPTRPRPSSSLRRRAFQFRPVPLLQVFLGILLHSQPYPPHAWIVRSGCEVQTAPGNGLLYLAVAWVRCLSRTWQPIKSRWLMGARLYQLSARPSDAGRRARPRWHHYPEPVSSDGAAGYTMRGDPGWPPMKTVLKQGMATEAA
jgi:hypothetical protein